MENVMAVGVGALFGFALNKGQTGVPSIISAQMDMTNFTMMRMFLAASATSTAVVLALDLLGLKKRTPNCGLSLPKLGRYGANLLGGALLGAGMYFTGSCPGTVWAQIGAQLPFTGSVVAGGLLGAMLFGYAEKHLSEHDDFQSKETCERSDLVPRGFPYAIAALTFIAAAVGAIVFFDTQVMPWQEGVQSALAGPVANPQNPVDPTASNWDPAVAGIVVGLLQLPVQLSSGNALGQSSGWVMLAGNMAGVVDKDLKEHAPYLHRGRTDRRAAFQLLIACGVVAGAAASQWLAGYPAMTAVAAQGAGSHAAAFGGGVMMLVGSRLGGGCTSGQGLSGMASLSIASLVTVIGMFAGGMASSVASGTFLQT